MLYLLKESPESNKLLAIKANDEGDIKARLKLKEGFKVLGRLTDNEVNTISVAEFCLIEA